MGMPNLPPEYKTDVKIAHHDIIDLLLISIALEELSLAHILNAEGEIIQTFLDNENCSSHPSRHCSPSSSRHCSSSSSSHCSSSSSRHCSPPPSRQELLKLNRSVTDLLKYVSSKEKTLQEKLENVIQYEEYHEPRKTYKC